MIGVFLENQLKSIFITLILSAYCFNKCETTIVNYIKGIQTDI